MLVIFVAVGILAILVAGFLVYKSVDFRKFLAGAFFVSSGVQFYLYFAKVSIPLLGTNYLQTPELSRVRGMVHLFLFLIFVYFAFFKKSQSQN